MYCTVTPRFDLDSVSLLSPNTTYTIKGISRVPFFVAFFKTLVLESAYHKTEIKMKSPLAIDKETIKEFKIPPEVELSPRQKLAFLEAQLGELKAMQWRSRVDVVHAKRLQESPIEALQAKGNNNIVEHKNQVQQFTGGIVMIQKMIEELREESGITEDSEE